MTRSVLTIAAGKKLYLDMAATLARSFRVWNRNTDIKFILATDRPEMVPSDLSWVDIHLLRPGEYGEGFSPKLHIDKMTDSDATLYIDADCLCTGPLDWVFHHFKGRAVSVIGKSMADGEWFGDIRDRCARFGVKSVPVFVGATYYFESGPDSKAVFEDARRYEARYDDIGLVRLRNRPNEEPLISIGMALNGQTPVPDDGTIKADAMHFPNRIDIDVLTGDVLFVATSGNRMVTSPRLPYARPVIAHFNDIFAQKVPYTREATKLKLVMGRSVPRPIAVVYAALTETVPKSAQTFIKDMFRPVYRRVFGVRRIAPNARM